MTFARSLLALPLFALLFFALMAAGIAIAPPPVSENVAASEFDAIEARARLSRILGDEAPHPIDSARQDETRAALIKEIEALGFTPEVRETFACRPSPEAPLIDCMMVRNVVFGIGPEEGPAVLAATHYDSVPAAPGASDAGIGIAAWLEVARALANTHLERRVIFLFTDGEEIALIGAWVFATQDKDMADVEAIINLEARGTRGPALFFETNRPNADAIAAFSGAPRGMANSIMADVYEILPNNTDVTELRRDGTDIINIALLEGLEHYHTPQDSLASQDPRSLQHMGDIALHVTRTLAGAPDRGDSQDLVYTDIAGRVFLSAPAGIARVLLALCVLAAFALFWRVGGVGRWRALALPPLALIFAGASAFAIGALFDALRGGGASFWVAHPEATRAWVILLALLGAAAAQALLRVGGATQAGVAAMFWFGALGFALTFVTPGISILFVIPLLVFVVSALIAFAWAPAQRIGASAAGVITLLVWAPLFYLVELALGYSMPYANALVAAVIVLPWLGALVATQEQSQSPTPVLTLVGALALALAWAGLSPSYSPQKPRGLNLTYVSNGVTSEAYVTAGSTRRRLPESLSSMGAFAPLRVAPGDSADTWAASAPIEQVSRPTFEGVRYDDAAREWRATLRTNGAYRTTLRIPRHAGAIAARLRGAEADFERTGGAGDFVNLACQGRSCDGAEVVIKLAEDAAALPWYVLGQYPTTTTEASRTFIARRGDDATPIQFGDSILTIDVLDGPGQAR